MEQYKLKSCRVSFLTVAPKLLQQSQLPHRQTFREQNTGHTPSQVSATTRAAVLTPLVKHINPFGCLSDEDNYEAPTVESTLVSTTSDKFSGMNNGAFLLEPI